MLTCFFDALLNHSNSLLLLIPFASALTLSVKIGLRLPAIFFCKIRPKLAL